MRIYILEINRHIYESADDLADWITKSKGYPPILEKRKVGSILYAIYKYIPYGAPPEKFKRIFKDRGTAEVWGY